MGSARKLVFKDGKSVCSGGYSIPYQFVLEKKNDSYVVISSKFPRDGSFYGKDIEELFPASIGKKIENANVDGTTEKLFFDIEEQVSRYYQDN